MSVQAKYLTPEILKGAVRDSLLKLNPRTQLRNPVMFIVLIGSVLTTVIGIGSLFGSFANEGRHGIHPVDLDLAVVHGALRQFRRGGRRGPRQGAGGDAARDARATSWPSA